MEKKTFIEYEKIEKSEDGLNNNLIMNLNEYVINSIKKDIDDGYTFIYYESEPEYNNIYKVKFLMKELCDIGEHDTLLKYSDIFELSTDSIICRSDSNIKFFKLK